jgi:hypothetical protein
VAVLGSRDALNSLMYLCKGVIWFLFATGAGITTVVSIASFVVPLRSQTFYIVGVHLVGLEPYCLSTNLS